MGKIAFISDFDGTLTFKDFYHIVIDKYMKEEGRRLYEEWKRTQKINVDFLNLIFSSMKLSEGELINEILSIPFDPAAIPFIERIRQNHWDFYIVSAGTSFYIKILLKHLGMDDIEVISMEGKLENGAIRILPNKQSPFYHEVFGIDKRKVLDSLKQKYDVVIFAGDSEPDFQAAKGADLVFARSELQNLMDKESMPYVHYENFSDIENYLMDKGWLK